MRLFLDVPKRHTQCAHGQEPFFPGSDCHSILKFEHDEWKRVDLCGNCWKGLAQTPMVTDAASTWITKIPPAINRDIAEKNPALNSFPLLKQALEKKTPKGDAEAFLIATYLVRKKFLKYVDQIEKNNEKFALYEVAETGEIIGIKKVPLSIYENPEVIEDIKKQLAQ